MDERETIVTLRRLVDILAEERGRKRTSGDDRDELWDEFRAYVNTRQPTPATQEFLSLQDALLTSEIARKGIMRVEDTEPSPTDGRLRLWQGDITCLAADAIVNAANTQMLGCWVPGHHCIDNAIHTYAGVQLRLACAKLMQRQGHDEPTGHAKVTPAFNLPARYVLHTVGPIYAGCPSPRQDLQLTDCYRSCLDAAEELGLTSVAFCCISTGVFGFPQEHAARIAVDATRSWFDAHDSGMTVVFNTFLDTDMAIYQRILGLGSSDDVTS